MAIKILALEGLTDNKLASLVEELVCNVNGVKQARIDLLSQRLSLDIQGRDVPEVVEEVVKLVKRSLPQVDIHYMETGVFSSDQPRRSREAPPQEEDDIDDYDLDALEDTVDEEDEDTPTVKKTIWGFLRKLRLEDRSQLSLLFTGIALVLLLASLLLDLGDIFYLVAPYVAFGLCCVACLMLPLPSWMGSWWSVIGVMVGSGLVGVAGSPGLACVALCLHMASRWVLELVAGGLELRISNFLPSLPEMAHVLEQGKLISIPANILQQGDLVLVLPGTRVPANGIVAKGESTIFPYLSASSQPIKPGDFVSCGDLNQQEKLWVRVLHPQDESAAVSLEQLLLKKSHERKLPEQPQKRDLWIRLAGILLAVAIPYQRFGVLIGPEFLSLAGCILALFFSGSLLVSLSGGYRLGMASALRAGMAIYPTTDLAAVGQADQVLMQRTGILTTGVFRVEEFQAVEGFQQEELLLLAASVESLSAHPIAAAILEFCTNVLGQEPSLKEVEKYEVIAGYGVRGMVERQLVVLGNHALMDLLGVGIPEQEDTDKFLIHLSIRGEYVGTFVLEDPARPDAASVISSLRASGISYLGVVTNCDQSVADSLQRQLGLNGAFSRTTFEVPDPFAQFISQAPKPILFLGGEDDLENLPDPHIKIALEEHPPQLYASSCHIHLFSSNPWKLVELLKFCRQLKRIPIVCLSATLLSKIIIGIGVLVWGWNLLGVVGLCGISMLMVYGLTCWTGAVPAPAQHPPEGPAPEDQLQQEPSFFDDTLDEFLQ